MLRKLPFKGRTAAPSDATYVLFHRLEMLERVQGNRSVLGESALGMESEIRAVRTALVALELIRYQKNTPTFIGNGDGI